MHSLFCNHSHNPNKFCGWDASEITNRVIINKDMFGQIKFLSMIKKLKWLYNPYPCVTLLLKFPKLPTPSTVWEWMSCPKLLYWISSPASDIRNVCFQSRYNQKNTFSSSSIIYLFISPMKIYLFILLNRPCTI